MGPWVGCAFSVGLCISPLCHLHSKPVSWPTPERSALLLVLLLGNACLAQTPERYSGVGGKMLVKDPTSVLQ